MVDQQEERWQLEKTEALARHTAAVAAWRQQDRHGVVEFARLVAERAGPVVAKQALASVKECAASAKW